MWAVWFSKMRNMLINKTQLSPLSGFQSPYGKKTINLSSYKSAHYLIFASFRLKINFSCFQSQVHRQLTMSRIFQLGIFPQQTNRRKKSIVTTCSSNILVKEQQTEVRLVVIGWFWYCLDVTHKFTLLVYIYFYEVWEFRFLRFLEGNFLFSPACPLYFALLL